MLEEEITQLKETGKEQKVLLENLKSKVRIGKACLLANHSLMVS